MENGDEDSREEIQPLEVVDATEDADKDWGGVGIEAFDLPVESLEIEVRELVMDAAGSSPMRSRDRADPELDRLMGWGEDSGDFGTFFDSLWRM